MLRLSKAAHIDKPWRIHAIASDFRVEDVWALPTPGGPDDFPRLVRQFADSNPVDTSRVVRALFAIRWTLGEAFGWDRPDSGVGTRVRTLRDRLPADLLAAPPGPDLRMIPFKSVYLIDDEWVSEYANRTVHALLHIGWVPDEVSGGYRGQLAILVKPNGVFGAAYLAAIAPVRRLIVYPSMIRMLGREWRSDDR
ncbi:DUF2867 domain-containing protein [Nocardia sp. CA-128927]|uniref:DUF2867 domain-containing protein n=1 Tax=Nocardia sp. CA-128927 TaxID=3239975 RepID=UPI003D95994D